MGDPFGVYAHPRLLETLAKNSIFTVLNPKRGRRHSIQLGRAFEPLFADGSPSGLEVEAFSMPGKYAWYLEGTAAQDSDEAEGDTIGLMLRAQGGRGAAHIILASAGCLPHWPAVWTAPIGVL